MNDKTDEKILKNLSFYLLVSVFHYALMTVRKSPSQQKPIAMKYDNTCCEEANIWRAKLLRTSK